MHELLTVRQEVLRVSTKNKTMEIIKPHHKPSERITRKNLKEAVKQAYELSKFLEDGNKAGFSGNWKNAIGLSHCQVSDKPFAMFAVSSELIKPPGVKMTRKQSSKNFYFPAQVIFNAEIIEAPDEVERLVPKREVIRKPNSKEFEIKMTGELKKVSNFIDADDACMSYPNRTKKKTHRYHTITVRYQVLRSFLGFKWLKTITEEVESFKSHIFQHEIDHSYGIDMYFGDGENRNPEKPYKNKVGLSETPIDNQLSTK